MKKLKIKLTLIMISGLFLSSCGGGDSSSGGGGASSVALGCLKVISRQADPVGETIVYENSCDFPINFGSRLITITIRNRNTISPGVRYTFSSLGSEDVIACRVPSIPIVVNAANGLGGTLTCT